MIHIFVCSLHVMNRFFATLRINIENCSIHFQFISEKINMKICSVKKEMIWTCVVSTLYHRFSEHYSKLGKKFTVYQFITVLQSFKPAINNSLQSFQLFLFDVFIKHLLNRFIQNSLCF